MLSAWLARLEKVHLARTPAEREAIFRFRYMVYVEELGKTVAEADVTRKWIKDPEDDAPETLLYYTGSTAQVTGALRLQIWAPGKVPAPFREHYALELFPDIDRCTVAETSRLMVHKGLRSRLVVAAMMRAAYLKTTEDRTPVISFGYCAPGLLRAYRRLGARPYGARLIYGHDGVRIPIATIACDVEFLKKVDSPLLALARERYGQGAEGFDVARYAHLFDDRSVTSDANEVWEQVEEAFSRARKEEPTFLQGVSAEAVKRIAEKGLSLELAAGETVTRAELLEQEIFLILEGTFEVVSKSGRRIATLQKGDVFGEIAFFREIGRRSASVRSVTPGKIVVLRRRFLEELANEEPRLALTLTFNLGRILAGRLARIIETP